METKECYTCKERLDVTAFCRRGKNTERLQSSCRRCRNKRFYSSRVAPVDLPDFKHCTKCNMVLHRASFSRHKGTSDGLQGRCTACRKACEIARREAKGVYQYDVTRKYGITAVEYAELLFIQGGVCAICKFPPSGKMKVLCVDHDHNTGAVRGLLCNGCNVGLGRFKDSISLLSEAVDYLVRNRAR